MDEHLRSAQAAKALEGAPVRVDGT